MQKLVLISRTAKQRENLLRLVKLFSEINSYSPDKILIDFKFEPDSLLIQAELIQPIEEGYNIIFFKAHQIYLITINSEQYNLVDDYYPLINVEDVHDWAEKNHLGIDC